MGLFTGLKDKKVAQRNPKIPAGNHVLQLVKLQAGQSRAGLKYLAADFKVESSNSPNLPPGTIVTNMIYMNNDGWEARLKEMLGGLLEYDDPNEVGDKEADEAFAPNNPLKGQLVRCQATAGKTKDGREAVYKSWFPYAVEE